MTDDRAIPIVGNSFIYESKKLHMVMVFIVVLSIHVAEGTILVSRSISKLSANIDFYLFGRMSNQIAQFSIKGIDLNNAVELNRWIAVIRRPINERKQVSCKTVIVYSGEKDFTFRNVGDKDISSLQQFDLLRISSWWFDIFKHKMCPHWTHR